MSEDLSTLKPGDEVAVTQSFPRRGYQRGKVSHRTASGQIVLTDGTRYNSDGREMRARHGRWDSRDWICLMTPDIRAQIERDEYLEVIDAVKWRDLSNEVLAGVVALVRQTGKEPAQ